MSKLLQAEQLNKHLIFIDIETTGLYYLSGDKIVEIACFYYKKDGSLEVFNHRVNPERKMSNGAFKIHKISDDMVKDSPKFSEIGQQFLDFITDGILVGHTIREFDIPFINNELKAAKLNTINNETIDIYKMYLERFPLSYRSASLDNICKMFQIDLSERINNGHGALLDARLAADCYEKISN
jgi:DNA polymerase III subunit epsilon